jgi:hypothetical protein
VAQEVPAVEQEVQTVHNHNIEVVMETKVIVVD